MGGESDIWTEYGGEVTEDKAGKERVYTKWKPPKNKLTQEIHVSKKSRKSCFVDVCHLTLVFCADFEA